MFLFFFNDPLPPEIYTLSLHDALPISALRGDARHIRRHRGELARRRPAGPALPRLGDTPLHRPVRGRDRKSTRLNSSHPSISYAVFCLKKKTTSTRPSEPASSPWAVQA